MSHQVVIEIASDPSAQRRFVVDGRRLRVVVVAAAVGLLAVVGGTAGLTWKLSTMSGNGPSAAAENSVLKGRLQAIEARMSRVDQSLERVMATDAKVRTLSQDDGGARAFGLQSLPALDLATAERRGLQDEFGQGEAALGPLDGLGVDESIEALVARTTELEASLLDEEESLQQVRTYLDDRASLVSAHPSVWPVRGWLTSRYGYRKNPYGGGTKLHAGIDIAAPRGTPVVAPSDGHVIFAGYHTAYGNLVVIDHGYGLSTKYAHMSRLHVRVGQRVHANELIGRVGNTGRSTGPHMHFEVHQDGASVNPLRYLEIE